MMGNLGKLKSKNYNIVFIVLLMALAKRNWVNCLMCMIVPRRLESLSFKTGYELIPNYYKTKLLQFSNKKTNTDSTLVHYTIGSFAPTYLMFFAPKSACFTLRKEKTLVYQADWSISKKFILPIKAHSLALKKC